MSFDLTNQIFNNETAAWKHFEAVRWPGGPVCPHCGVINSADPIIGKTARHELYRCRECVRQFTATIGTIYEGSHIPMHKWLLAAHLMCASKKGMSAHQLWRMLGFGSYRTAWFMCHRIREAMNPATPGPIGGESKVVESDETVFGGKAKNRAHAKTEPKKHTVMTLVERDGKSRSFHIANVKAKTLREKIITTVSRKSHLMTDELASYEKIGKEFANHGTVNHSADEYVRTRRLHSHQHCRMSFQPHEARRVWCASLDQRSSPSALPCGMGFQMEHPKNKRRGTCGNCSEGIEGKRLTYRQANETAHTQAKG